MDQHRDGLASDGWREARIDWQAERAQLRDQLDKLHKTIDRLHALRPEYQKLIKTTQQSLLDAHALERDMNAFAISLELSPIPRRNLEWESTETTNYSPSQALLFELEHHWFTLEEQELITPPEQTTPLSLARKISIDNTSTLE